MSAKNPPVPTGPTDPSAAPSRDGRARAPGSTRRMVIAVAIVLAIVAATAFLTVAGAVRQHRHSVVAPGPAPAHRVGRVRPG